MSFYLEKDYFEDPALFELVQRVMQGNLTLHWYDAKTERVRAVPLDSRRGLTYDDVSLGSYSYQSIPEIVRRNCSMAARGSEIWGRVPDLGYEINRKSDVWSDDVAALYEEAKSRRWAPAIDVAWARIAESPLPAATEAAVAQLCTTLEEISLVGLEMPSRWVSVINQEFLEMKSFLCAQMLDQARAVEVFRKRALAGGQGLKRASVSAEQALKELLFAGTYPEASLGVNVMLGSALLTLFRFAAAVAPSEVDRKIFVLALQDKARHVAYGMSHMRYHLAHQPRQLEVLWDYLDRTEHCLLGILGSPELFGALTVIAGGGADAAAIALGRRRVASFVELAAAEYFERCERLGFRGRAKQSRLASTLREVLFA